jgi:tetratricopeptide (TPR) repeat protein
MSQVSVATINPDRLAELEEERRFLLRSLADLEREYEAGDVDEVDYRALREGYTVRAAATLRELDDGRSSLPPKQPADWRRRIVSGLIIVVLIGVVWWALAASTAERRTGQQITGLDPRDEQQVLMSEARALQLQAPAQAAEIYGQVLALDPDNVEALTYRGWTLALDATIRAQTTGADTATADGAVAGGGDDPVVTQLKEAVDLLLRANQADPDYADPKCFLGIVNFRTLGDAAAAKPWVDACLASNPPADVLGLVQGLQVSIDAELAGAASPPPAPRSTAP